MKLPAPPPAVPPRPRDSGPSTPGPPPSRPGGQICGLFAVDVAAFTDPRRDEYVQLYVREMLYRILERAFDGSGIPWRSCRHEDRGDGVVVVVPPVIPVDGLADPLPERLCGLIRVHNRLSSEDARIQLRAAAHVGKVYHDGHGFAGDAASHLFRLLQASGFKQLLATSECDLAFIASDYFYDTVIRPPPHAGRPGRIPAGHRGPQARHGHRLGPALGSAPPGRPHRAPRAARLIRSICRMGAARAPRRGP